MTDRKSHQGQRHTGRGRDDQDQSAGQDNHCSAVPPAGSSSVALSVALTVAAFAADTLNADCTKPIFRL